jgi:hypothetical protein
MRNDDMARKGILQAIIVPGLLLFMQVGVPEHLGVAGVAQASVSVNISINSFYDDLADDGDWIWYRGRYVWVPEAAPRWRPYLYGHWVYTRRHGWYWVSDEPFGWAVYHYGRWAFDPVFGWYWVPGRRWAPAWVAWSHTDDDIGWAPLPPEYDDDEVHISISINSIPVDYWNVVPVTVFASTDVDRYVVRDHDYIHRVITRDEPQTVVIQNNTVINNFMDVDVLERRTKRDIAIYEVQPTDRPEAAGKREQNTIAVFNPEVNEEPTAKPRRLKRTEDVIKKKKALRDQQKVFEETGEPALTTDGDAVSPDDENRRAKIRKKLQAQPDTQAGEERKRKKEAVGELQPGEQSVQERTSKKKRKRLLQDQEVSSAPTDEPVKKRKKKSAVELEGASSGQQPVEEPAKKRKKQAVEKSQQIIEGEDQTARKKKRGAQARQGEEQAAQQEDSKKQARKKSKKKPCDPQIEECHAAD